MDFVVEDSTRIRTATMIAEEGLRELEGDYDGYYMADGYDMAGVGADIIRRILRALDDTSDA